MARRKRKQDTSLRMLLGAVLCIYVFFALINNNLPVVLLLVIVLGVFVAVTIALPSRNRRRLLDKVDAVIGEHAQQLAKRRAQLVRQDPYGKVRLEKWHEEVEYFINEHIRPSLTAKQQSILDREQGEIARMVMERAETETQQTPVFKAFSDTMTPTEFEAFCAEQLRASGWDAQLTQTTGDQGVDVIAEKNGLLVVLQCKKYSGSVGNGAVQEVVAGRAHERAHYCAVVTNSRYTSAAEQLAATNGVLLLHYSELPRLESLLQSKCAVTPAPADSPAQLELTELVSQAGMLSIDTVQEESLAIATVADSPMMAVESPPQETLPVIADERPPIVPKTLLIVGGAIVGVLLATVLLSKGKHQPAVIINNRPATNAAPKKHAVSLAFTTYTNNKFGFRIDYPKSFVTTAIAENGDGITLTSPDGAALLVVAGANNDAGYTLQNYYDNSVKAATGELGYQRLGNSWFVVTWREGDHVIYQKMFAGSGSQNSFTFTFPENQRSTYEQITTRMEKSFRPGALDQAW